MIHAIPARTSRSSNLVPYLAALAKLTLLEARSSLLWITMLLALTCWLLILFLMQVSIIEGHELSATVAGGVIRLAAAFLTAGFVVSSMAREADDKITDLLLSQPAPRWAYFAGRGGGFALVAIALALMAGAPLWLHAPQGIVIWQISLATELVMVSTIGLFCSLTLAQPVAALATTAGFYVLARTAGTLRLMAESALGYQHGWADQVIAILMKGLTWLLPALDRVTQSGWLLATPDWTEAGMAVGQLILYTALVGSAALFDLYRRNY